MILMFSQVLMLTYFYDFDVFQVLMLTYIYDFDVFQVLMLTYVYDFDVFQVLMLTYICDYCGSTARVVLIHSFQHIVLDLNDLAKILPEVFPSVSNCLH